MNVKDHITEKQVLDLLSVLKIHKQMMDKMNARDIGNFMKQKLFKQHKTFIDNLYEELDNVNI